MTGRHKAATTGIAMLVLLACLARFVHLDADPAFPTWVGYITDEGRWNESARNLVLFGHTQAFAERIHLLLSPAYQSIAVLVFKLNGVNLASARLSAAVSGCAIVLLVAWFLRRHVSALALATGVLILGFEAHMLAESRMALPEIPAALGMLVCFLVLVLAPQTRRNAAIAGGLLVVALAMKGTMALVAPAMLVVAAMHGEQSSWRARADRLLAFCAGAAVPVGSMLMAGLAAGVVPLEKLLTLGDRLLGFISLLPGREFLWQLFESQEQLVRNVLLLGVWCGAWIWLHRQADSASVTTRLYVASAVWAGWSALIWAVNAYAPGRYVVHVIVPVVLHLIAAISVGDRDTSTRIEARLCRSAGLTRLVWLAGLVLPAAVIATSLLVGLVAWVGLDFGRISVRLVLIAAFTLVLSVLVHRNGVGRQAVMMCILAPAVAAVAWYLGWEFGVFHQFWENRPQAGSLVWLSVCAAALVVADLHARAELRRRRSMHAAVLMAAAVLLLIRAAAPLLAPTFTIRDASRDLGRVLPPLTRDEIVVHSASSLFLDNTLRYRELFEPHEQFEWLLTFENNGSARRALRRFPGQPVEPFKAYPFAFDPRYTFDPMDDGPVRAVLWRRPTVAARQPASAPGVVVR